MILPLYQGLTAISAPLLRSWLGVRCQAGKEDPARLLERTGQSKTPPFPTPPIWIHGASVGEAQSALIVIEIIHQIAPGFPVLLTSGTRTSAELMATRLPTGCLHQYIPLDHPKWVARFLDYWKPCAALWMESELWPNLLLAMQERYIPAVLLNARMSERSFRRWSFFPETIRELLATFHTVMAESDRGVSQYVALGARSVRRIPNLKFASHPLTVDPQALDNWQKSIGTRPVWVYASSHADEEQIARRIHLRLKQSLPDVLTIIVPRHPNRTPDILKHFDGSELHIARRSTTAAAPAGTDIFIVDILGEMGLYFALAPVAMIGRSLSLDGGGGHNPIEAAQLGCLPLHGPHVQNLQSIYDEMGVAQATIAVQDEESLYNTLLPFLQNTQACRKKGLQAQAFIQSRQGAIRQEVSLFIKDHLGPLLGDRRAA